MNNNHEVQEAVQRIRDLIGRQSPRPVDATPLRTAFENSLIRVDETHVRSTVSGAATREPRISPSDPDQCFGIVVPVLSDGRLLLVVRYRYAPAKWSVEFPRVVGRTSEDGWKEIVELRLLEEVGAVCSDVRLLGAINWEPVFATTNALVFAGGNCELRHAPAGNDALLAGSVAVSPTCLDQLICQGTIECALTLAALTMYRARRYTPSSANAARLGPH